MTADAQRYALVHGIVAGAFGLEGERLSAYLATACPDDPLIRAEVEELLALADDRDDLLAEGRIYEARLALDRVVDDALEQGAVVEEPSARTVERIGRYRVLRKIGEGGMGVVYEAEQDDSLRRVALKVVRPALVTPRLLRRFRREVRLLGKLQHPGIAQLYDVGSHDVGLGEQPFFAMELVHGVPIDRFAAEQQLEVPERLELIARVCDALHFAHEKGIIHRDLKPANILIASTSRPASDGSRATFDAQPKILDFGVARAADVDHSAITLHTTPGQLIGTLPYMSPEQAVGDPDQLDRRSDVYALGVIAFELLAGTLPYGVRGKLVHEAVRTIREDDPTSLGALDATLRGDVETIVAKALEKDPQRRYASAAEFAADLRRTNENLPIRARPPSTVYQLRKFARRNKTLVGGALATLLVALAGAGIALRYALDASERAAELGDVVDFQSRQLKDIDALTLGERQREQLLSQARIALEHAGAAVVESELAGLEELLAQVNFTDFALQTLDEAIFSRALHAAREQFEDQPLVEARLSHSLGSTMRSIGLRSRAREALARALELRQAHLGPDHPETFAAMAELGCLDVEAGRPDEAEPLLRAALEGRRRILPPDHEGMLESFEWMAFCLERLGRDEEARLYIEEKAQWYERTEGADSLNRLLARASLLHSEGRVAEGLSFQRRAIEVLRSTRGPNSAALAVTYSNTAAALKTEGEYEEAEELYREALAGGRRVYGNHLFTADRLIDLGELLVFRGADAEAEELLHEAQAILADNPDAWESQALRTQDLLETIRERR